VIPPEILLETARGAAQDAGRALMERFRSGVRVAKKGRIDLVTEMDLRAQEIILERIRSRFPGHGILAEEGCALEGTEPYRWIVDPLDGTTNYAHGYRFFCVSVAVEEEGRLVAGVVHDPVTEETFSALRGRGAVLNGLPIRVSGEESLVDSLLVTGFSYRMEEIERNLLLFERVIRRARAVRRDGSAALDLCYVACGRFDGFWELSLNAWDVAAGSLILEEAGGRLSLFDGSACTIHDRELLATNGRIHEGLSRVLVEGEG
jgi:myo-inositol-1(or 4)-monophosphatase